MKIVKTDESGLEEAAAVLASGGVAVIPADTVYGLAARHDLPDAVERLYTIKARESKKPIAMLAANLEAVERSGFQVPSKLKPLVKKHWPGALTLVLEGLNGATEGFRVPDHEWTRRLLARCGGLLRVTSANLSGMRPALDAPAALADVGLSADIVVDGGTSPGGVPSTVIRALADGSAEMIREGAVDVHLYIG